MQAFGAAVLSVTATMPIVVGGSGPRRLAPPRPAAGRAGSADRRRSRASAGGAAGDGRASGRNDRRLGMVSGPELATRSRRSAGRADEREGLRQASAPDAASHESDRKQIVRLVPDPTADCDPTARGRAGRRRAQAGAEPATAKRRSWPSWRSSGRSSRPPRKLSRSASEACRARRTRAWSARDGPRAIERGSSSSARASRLELAGVARRSRARTRGTDQTGARTLPRPGPATPLAELVRAVIGESRQHSWPSRARAPRARRRPAITKRPGSRRAASASPRSRPSASRAPAEPSPPNRRREPEGSGRARTRTRRAGRASASRAGRERVREPGARAGRADRERDTRAHQAHPGPRRGVDELAEAHERDHGRGEGELTGGGAGSELAELAERTRGLVELAQNRVAARRGFGEPRARTGRAHAGPRPRLRRARTNASTSSPTSPRTADTARRADRAPRGPLF